jgi:hypothetical protein
MMLPALFSLAPGADAGRHARGVLALHADQAVSFSEGKDYCAPVEWAKCGSLNTSVSSAGTTLIRVIAMFPEEQEVTVSAISFGIEYHGLTILDHGPCADAQVSTSNWPNSGEGIRLTWDDLLTEHPRQIYWFVVESDGRAGRFALSRFSSVRADIVDGSRPGPLDAVDDLGIIGFNAPGYSRCPDGGRPAVCCLPDSSCLSVDPTQCEALDGSFLRDDSCYPNPCRVLVRPVPGAAPSEGYEVYLRSLEYPDSFLYVNGVVLDSMTDESIPGAHVLLFYEPAVPASSDTLYPGGPIGAILVDRMYTVGPFSFGPVERIPEERGLLEVAIYAPGFRPHRGSASEFRPVNSHTAKTIYLEWDR